MNLIDYIFYRGTRVGLHGKTFKIWKIRTMCLGADQKGSETVPGDDPRITRIGGFLRKSKLDELPQFINVLKGEMSLVGPRPDTPGEIGRLPHSVAEIILSVKPGITDLASLWNFAEAEELTGKQDPDAWYHEHIEPRKRQLQVYYVKHKSRWLDLKIVFWTILKLLRRGQNIPCIPNILSGS